MIAFFIPGDPVSQGRARSFRRGDFIGHYDDPKSAAWKKTVSQVAKLQRDRDCGDKPLEIRLTFWMPNSKKSEKIIAAGAVMHHTKKPDVDNLSKAILDALNGICYKDDSQVVCLFVMKQYANILQGTGVRVEIRPLE